ncbi:circadian clock-controlled protein daywake-like [Musca autumnalis]|uniref:circadian clock-controlled protein daywake-like n=1 Tax=Musca autumnalis TaxID=221902 RepID=UPI003CEBB833
MDSRLIPSFCFLVIFGHGAVVNGASILTEKPSFLKTCATTDPSFSSCLTNNFQGLFQQWKSGIPGLKSVGTLEPVHVKKIKFHHKQPPVDLHILLQKVEINGLGDVKGKQTSFNPKTLTATVVLVVPKLKLHSDYAVKGNTRSFTLDGSGKLDLSADNLVIHLKLQLKLRQTDGYTFADIDKVNLDITEVGDFHIHLDNLFNGQKELEDTVNNFLNSNWRSFYEAVRPGISAAIEAVLKERLAKVFASIPANYFIANISSL